MALVNVPAAPVVFVGHVLAYRALKDALKPVGIARHDEIGIVVYLEPNSSYRLLRLTPFSAKIVSHMLCKVQRSRQSIGRVGSLELYPASAAGVGIKGGVGGECESCTIPAIGSHMAVPITLKLSGIDRGNSVSVLVRVRGRMIQDS